MYLTLNRPSGIRPRLRAYNGASFDRLFDEFFQPVARAPRNPAVLAARFDVVEKTDRFEARVEIPGVTKEDIDVQIDGATVRIKAEAKAAPKNDGAQAETADDGAKVLHSNRVTRSWARDFTLPAEVDESRAEAAYENGVLTLTLPKKEVVQPKRLAIR